MFFHTELEQALWASVFSFPLASKSWKQFNCLNQVDAQVRDVDSCSPHSELDIFCFPSLSSGLWHGETDLQELYHGTLSMLSLVGCSQWGREGDGSEVGVLVSRSLPGSVTSTWVWPLTRSQVHSGWPSVWVSFEGSTHSSPLTSLVTLGWEWLPVSSCPGILHSGVSVPCLHMCLVEPTLNY